jgi:predicted S18 family serine protease
MPVDDTIPQNTEGVEVLTLAVTPTNTSNKLLIEVVVYIAHSANSTRIAAALFQDSTADALAAVSNIEDTGGRETVISFKHYMTAGTDSATTFKVRVGGNNAGTLTFNGFGGARKFGGVAASSITISEIEV